MPASGAVSSSIEPGRVLEGRYRLDSPLGEGGLGVVWRGFHLRLGKPVAIKLMQPEHLGRENLHARFEREARSLATLTHPNVVDVIDFGVDGEQPFLVMELLEGRPLDRALADGIAPDRALAIARDVLRALAHAHAHGIVHRDLKPANVFLQRISDGSEIVRVLDFGLAKFVDREGAAGGGAAAGSGGAGAKGGAEAPLTRAGTVLGTPAYMAPEQATGGSADARADVYSCGILMFELLAGRRPFEGEGGELIRQHLLVPMPSVASVRPELEVAPELEAVLQRATAKSASARYASAREMMEDVFALPVPAVRAIRAPEGEGEGASAVSAEARVTSAPGARAPDPPTIDSTPSGAAAAAAHGATSLDVASAKATRPLPVRPERSESAPVPAAAAGREPDHGAAATAATAIALAPDTTPMPALDPSLARDPSLAYAPPAPSHATDAQAASASPSLDAPASYAPPSPSVVAPAAPSDAAPRRAGLGLGAWLAIGVGLAAVSALVVIVALALGNATRAASGSPTAATAPPAAAGAASAADTSDADASAAPWFAPDPDPWAEEAPAPLAAIHARLESGRTLTRGDRRALRAYVGRVRDDVRPWLLLARGDVMEGHRTDACDRYERALAIDESLARGDAHILADLARLAAHHAVADEAAALIRSRWGARALPTIDETIAALAAEHDDEGAGRLRRLRDLLVRGATVSPAALPRGAAPR